MATVVSEGQLAGIGSHQLTPRLGLPRGVNLYSGRAVSYAQLYRRQPNVRTVVSFLGRNLGQVVLRALRRVSDVERQRLDPAHPLAVTLAHPDTLNKPPLTRFAFVNRAVQDMSIFGAAAFLKVDGGHKIDLVHIPHELVDMEASTPWGIDRFLIGGRRKLPVEPDKVLYLPIYNPEDPRIGLSPLETLRRVLAEEDASGEWREQFWRNGARISGVIERPLEAGTWSTEASDRFREGWASSWGAGGSDEGGTPILEDGMVWKDAMFSPRQAEYLGARRLTREESAAAFHIQPAHVGILENANFSNMREQRSALYQDTLGPWIVDMEQAFEAQLLYLFDDVDDVQIRFEIDSKLRANFEERVAALQTATGAPWMLRSEARTLADLPPIDGADGLVVPLNVLVGGQASPTDATPPTRGRAVARKSIEELPAGPRSWANQHLDLMVSYFSRQRQALKSRLGAGWDLTDAFELERWDTELGGVLGGLAIEVAGDVGTSTAEALDVEWDADRAEGWLVESGSRAAGRINAATLSQLVAARLAPAVDEDLSSLAWADGVFDVAESSRASQIAISRTTMVSGWAALEVGRQNDATGVMVKVWGVNSGNSRHPELDGETVPVGDEFSNGGRWPGDPGLPADERAGCTCSMSIERGD